MRPPYILAAIGALVFVGCGDTDSSDPVLIDNSEENQTQGNDETGGNDASNNDDEQAQNQASNNQNQATNGDETNQTAGNNQSDPPPDPCEDMQEPGVAQPNCGPSPLTVEFDGSGFVDGMEYRYPAWEFGDGEMSSELDPTHTYLEPGDYTASFSVYVTTDGYEADLSLDDIQIRVTEQ